VIRSLFPAGGGFHLLWNLYEKPVLFIPKFYAVVDIIAAAADLAPNRDARNATRRHVGCLLAMGMNFA
jgi:hypothetical protein